MPKATEQNTTSPFHNHSAGDLADALGAIKADIADLEAREKAIRDVLVRRKVAEAEGALFRATISDAVRWTIDSAKVKKEMGEDWWTARCKTGCVTIVKVSARTGAVRLAA